jgi:hypothetical protein
VLRLGLGLGLSKATVPPPLDDIGSSLFAAYSFSRKLRTAYNGNAFTVRRSSDNTTQDIGFSGNNIDTASLLSFVGAGSGYITKVYDQSGNALDLAQGTTAAQPRIVNSGVLDTVSGKASPVFTDAHYLEKASVSAPNAAWSFLSIVKRNNTVANCLSGNNSWDAIWRWGNANGYTTASVGFYLSANGNTGNQTTSAVNVPEFFGEKWLAGGAAKAVGAIGTPIADAVATLWDGTLDASNRLIRKNGTTLDKASNLTGSPASGTGTLTLGSISPGNALYWTGQISEFILFNVNAEADMSSIRQNLLQFWSYADPVYTRGVKGVSSQYITIGNQLEYERTQPWTVVWSVLIPKKPTNHAIVNGNVVTAPAFPGWETFVSSSGLPQVRIINDIRSNYLGVAPNGSYKISDGSPHVVTITYDGSSNETGVKFYVDGVLMTNTTESNTLSASIVEAGNAMWLLNQKNYETTFWGENVNLFRLQIHNVERDATWAAARVNEAAWAAPDANTVLDFDFDERAGTTTADNSASGFTGTLSNTSLWI